jgi:hypothetical protein
MIMATAGRENLTVLARELRLCRDSLTDLVERVAALQGRLRTDAPTIVSLDRLAQRRHPVTPVHGDGNERQTERFEGEEAAMATDAWEITLITEEG